MSSQRRRDSRSERIYTSRDVRHAHVELTTRCNAACPMCARMSFGRTNPRLHLSELSERQFRSIFSKHFVQQLEAIDLCGAYGDPIVAKDLLPIVQYLTRVNHRIAVQLFTNGSARDKNWWSKLATAISPLGRVVFAIDGLGGTNQIYRRHTRFQDIINNACSFIQAGGRAQWDFIVFEHNEHQVEEARSLSRALGFEVFNTKLTGRFAKVSYEDSPIFFDGDGVPNFPIHGRDATIDGMLRPPRNPAYQNNSSKQLLKDSCQAGRITHELEKTTINCKVSRSKSVFVAADGTVFPCCWMYSHYHLPSLNAQSAENDKDVHRLLQDTGGLPTINAHERDLTEIVDGDFFLGVAKSFDASDFASGRLPVCARVCGDYVDQFSDQYPDIQKAPQGTGGINNDEAEPG